ncbi:MAG: hypothetical protein Q9180_004333 [Flavoplaca navasiana]
MPPTITSPASMLISRTSRKTLSYCRPNVTTVNYEYDILPPTFTDLDLEGCYAGTGGLTVRSRTFKSGEIDVPASDYSWIGTGGDFVATMACSDFMIQEGVVDSIAWSFQRSPICTSYANWWHENDCSLNDQVLMPPGVFSDLGWGHNQYQCCGGCNIYDPPHVRVLFWPPDTTSDCSNLGETTKVNDLLTKPTNVEPRTVGDGSVGSPRLAVVEGVTL